MASSNSNPERVTSPIMAFVVAAPAHIERRLGCCPQLMGSDQFATLGLRPVAWYVGIGGISLIIMCAISGFWGSLFAPLPAFFTLCVLRRLKAKALKPPIFLVAFHMLAVLFLLIASSPIAYPQTYNTAPSVILSCIHLVISFWMHAGYMQPIVEDMLLTAGGAGQSDGIASATSRADQSAQIARQSVATAGYNMAPLAPPGAGFYAMPQYSQAAPVYYAAPAQLLPPGAGNANPGWTQHPAQSTVGDATSYGGKGGSSIPMATQVI